MTVITAESLLANWFWAHYPEDVRRDPFLHRDVDANPGGNPKLTETLAEAATLFADNAGGLWGRKLTLDDGGVAELARALTRARRDEWMAQSDPRDPDNLFLNTVLHASAFVGEVAVRAHSGKWSLRRPMWESLVLRPGGGSFSPFHWLLRSLADDSIDSAPLAVRWRLHVELATLDLDALPIITAPRKLPVLKAPSYDLFVRYLQQHLPGLSDVGEGFPSPEEFTARSYDSLGFVLLHGGRALALHGQTRGDDSLDRVEVLWLTATGFDHADILPCDNGMAHFARAITTDSLEVTTALRGKPNTHRLSLRGHH